MSLKGSSKLGLKSKCAPLHLVPLDTAAVETVAVYDINLIHRLNECLIH